MLTLLLMVSVTVYSADASGKCQCKNHTEIRCKTDASAVDMCFSCDSTQTDCMEATSVYFHYPSICAEANVTSCCPDVQTVFVDSEILCSCYCPLEAQNILVLNSTPGFGCNCGGLPAIPTTTLFTNSNLPSNQNKNKTPLIVGVAFGVCIPAIVFTAIIISYVRYKNRLTRNGRMRMDNESDDNDRRDSNNSDEMQIVESTVQPNFISVNNSQAINNVYIDPTFEHPL